MQDKLGNFSPIFKIGHFQVSVRFRITPTYMPHLVPREKLGRVTSSETKLY
jgi:hypothetical protein